MVCGFDYDTMVNCQWFACCCNGKRGTVYREWV